MAGVIASILDHELCPPLLCSAGRSDSERRRRHERAAPLLPTLRQRAPHASAVTVDDDQWFTCTWFRSVLENVRLCRVCGAGKPICHATEKRIKECAAGYSADEASSDADDEIDDDDAREEDQEEEKGVSM